MKRYFLFIILSVGIAFPSFSVTSRQEKAAESKENRSVRKKQALFGEEAANLYQIFLDQSITKEEVISGETACRTVIRNRETYYQIRSLIKDLARQVRNNTLSQEAAAARLIPLLQSAIKDVTNQADEQPFLTPACHYVVMRVTLLCLAAVTLVTPR